MRTELIRLILSWMETDNNVVFLTADIGGVIYKTLYKSFPERVFNVGIAEQNMIGMAAGLTNIGFRVICYSKACFISLRVVDQIKNALCYSMNNVILIASDAGYDEANAGYSHISLEDIGVIQSLPNIDIYLPSTTWGLNKCFQKIRNSIVPSYLRMNKGDPPSLNSDFQELSGATYFFKIAKIKKTLYVSYGYSIIEALREAEHNAETSILAIDDLQFDEDIMINELKKYDKVIVIEEQFENCGIYNIFCRLFIKRKIQDVVLERIGPQFMYIRYCFERENIRKAEWETYKGDF